MGDVIPFPGKKRDDIPAADDGIGEIEYDEESYEGEEETFPEDVEPAEPISEEEIEQIGLARAVINLMNSLSGSIAGTGPVYTKASFERIVGEPLTENQFRIMAAVISDHVNTVIGPIIAALVLEVWRQLSTNSKEE